MFSIGFTALAIRQIEARTVWRPGMVVNFALFPVRVTLLQSASQTELELPLPDSFLSWKRAPPQALQGYSYFISRLMNPLWVLAPWFACVIPSESFCFFLRRPPVTSRLPLRVRAALRDPRPLFFFPAIPELPSDYIVQARNRQATVRHSVVWPRMCRNAGGHRRPAMPFLDRSDAGRRLAERLRRYAKQPGCLVLALPRGGVPVAYEAARVLDLPLDVFLVRKLGVPGHTELAMGALASGGVRFLNQDVVRALHISSEAIEAVARKELRELERREREYREGRPAPEVA